jgi:multiple antibiotic resistance protein
LPIVNPLGSAPIFLAQSADLPLAAQRHLAWVVARNALALLVAAMLAGSYVLAFFGISIPIVRVAGGLVLLAAGWESLHVGDVHDAPPTMVAEVWWRETARRGFYPLTFPLTVGPGSISVAITLGAGAALDRPAGLLKVGGYLMGALIVASTIYVSYRFAPKLMTVLGENGYQRLPATVRVHSALRRRGDLLERHRRLDPGHALVTQNESAPLTDISFSLNFFVTL